VFFGNDALKIQYDNIAEEYARLRKSDINAVESLIQGGGLSNTSTVLEIGCGTGNYIAAVQGFTGSRCFGIDPSKGMIQQAKQKINGVTFSVCSSENLHFEVGFFDFVFSVDVIHHITDRARYFSEAFRVLKPGGLLATLTDSDETIRKRMPLAFYFPETIEHDLKRYPDIRELKQYSRKVGFQVGSEEVVETPYTLNNIDRFSQKAFSCLKLISEESFIKGIETMKRDLEAAPIQCVSRNFVLWNKK
jgi:ubiquinone/menaquinone biosynthesis C-methylase UbiE